MPRIGEMLAGRYRLDALIGSGGFAAVYRAHDLRLERDVALKVLLASHASDPVIAARFDREARVLAAVSHPNVVAIHDVEPGDPASGTEPFLVMDLCEGGSLADRLAAAGSGVLPPDELVPILVEVAAGLDSLHARGIVHRDLKPSNILLSDGRAQIADLGIAAIGPSELTAAGTTIGTLAYLAPEQLAGDPGSPATDVHALGTIAFLGLTGQLPRPAETYAQVVTASGQTARPVSSVVPGLAAFDAVIAQALAVSPSVRPTAGEFATALGAALERWRATPAAVAASAAITEAAVPLPGVIPVAPPPTAVPAAPPAPRTGRGLVVVAAIVLALLVLGTAALAWLQPDGVGEQPSPTATASSSAQPTPTVTPSPTATVDPYVDARAASDEMRAAIADARGSHGLNGRQARDLENLLDGFNRALDDNDPATARGQANELANQVADFIEQGAVDADGAARLQAAADALVAAANDLPS